MVDITDRSDVSQTADVKSLAGLYRWLRRFFITCVVGFILIGLGSAWFAISVPPDYDVTVDLLSADWVVMIGGFIGMLSLLLSIIFFSIFTFRAMKNLHVWGARNARMAPGWAVGWYFIPFALLFMPYKGMDQIVDGSMEVNDLPVLGTPRLLLWWICWIAGGILDRIALRVDGGFTTIVDVPMQQLSAWITVASSTLLVIAALTILSVLKDVTQLQEQRRLALVTV